MQRIGAEKPVVVQCLHDGDGGGVSGKENSRRQARKTIVNVEDIWTEGMKYRCSALVRRVRVKRVYGSQRTRSRRGDCSVVKREQLNLVTRDRRAWRLRARRRHLPHPAAGNDYAQSEFSRARSALCCWFLIELRRYLAYGCRGVYAVFRPVAVHLMHRLTIVERIYKTKRARGYDGRGKSCCHLLRVSGHDTKLFRPVSSAPGQNRCKCWLYPAGRSTSRSRLP